MRPHPSFASVCLAILLAACHSAPPPIVCDVWIRGGEVVDGSGALPERADVFVRDGLIVAIDAPAAERSVTAAHELDATGCVVTPGFIDVHAHGDPLRNATFRNFLAQGVTTICLGQDGASPSRGVLSPWLDAVARQPLGPNIIAFTGHGTLRRVADIDDAPTDDPVALTRLAELVAADLEAGAFGLSTGLEYEPGRFANSTELLEIAKPVAAANAMVMSHMRSEDDDTIERAIDELLQQCAGTGCAAHVSHFKVVYGHGEARARELLAQLDTARRRGLRVTADVYPYLASYTGIGIVFPDWARPPVDFDDVKATRRDELAAYLRERVAQRNGPAATLFGSGPFAGKTLAAVAAELGKPFEDVLIDDVGVGGASAAYFVMAQEVMHTLLADPHVMVSSDGSPTMRHPRGYGAFARVIRESVIERGELSLQEAVRKMTGLPAGTLGLGDRGRVGVGAVADLAVFDPRELRDRATFERPFELATGMRFVLVGGQLAWRDGQPTDVRAGRVLRRQATPRAAD